MDRGSPWSAQSMGTPFSSHRVRTSVFVSSSGPPDLSPGKSRRKDRIGQGPLHYTADLSGHMIPLSQPDLIVSVVSEVTRLAK